MPTNDYSEQLRTSLSTTRDSIIAQQVQFLAQQQQNITTLGHAEQTLALDDSNFLDAIATLDFAEKINKLATQGTLFVKNCITLASNSSTQAASANTALATTAASIKNAADLLDTLTAQVAGVHAIAKNDDAKTVLDNSSYLAATLADRASRSVETLKSLSLTACISSAQSTASAASLSVGVTGKGIDAVTSQASTFLSSSTDALTKRRATDSSSEQSEKLSLQAYDTSRTNNQSVTDSIAQVDALVNGALSVVQPTNQIQLKVSYNLSGSVYQDLANPALPSNIDGTVQLSTSTTALYFFAVNSVDAPSFSWDSAKRLVKNALISSQQPTEANAPAPAPAFVKDNVSAKAGQNVSFSPTISYDIDGNPILPGVDYTVFVMNLPAQEILWSPGNLSLPSLTTTVCYTIAPLPQPSVSLQAAASAENPTTPPIFTVSLPISNAGQENVASIELTNEYRFFVVRQHVYNTIAPDVLFLADLLNSSYYQPVAPGGNTIECAYYEGGSTDMYGGIIDPEVAYVALVMAVGGTDRIPSFIGSGVKEREKYKSLPENTPNVISPASAPFTYGQPPLANENGSVPSSLKLPGKKKKQVLPA